MPRITPFKIALACGSAGAYVDVTSYASWTPGEGVAGSWGRQDQFRDTTPGAFSFYLDNYDGRFTPDATNGLLATPLTEGMGVSWQLGARIIAGSILGFTMIEDNWGRIRIDADDMLGNLARTNVTLTARAMVLGANPYLYWPFNDAAGTGIATEQSGNGQPPFDATVYGAGVPTFGATALPYLGDAQASVQGGVSQFLYGTTGIAGTGSFATIAYPSGSMGCWGMWITPGATFQPSVNITVNGSTHPINLGNLVGTQWGAAVGSHAVLSSLPIVAGVPTYLQAVVTYANTTSVTVELFVNGVSQGTATDPTGYTTNFQRTPQYVSISDNGTDASIISHLSHTPSPVREYLLANQTEAGILTATASASTKVALATLPTDLSTAPSLPQSSAGSALAKMNDVIRTEQGYLDCVTTGSLTAPVQAIRVRSRTRSATVAYSFDSLLELSGQPDLIRDLTNLIASETAQGPTTSTTWLDPTASARASSSNNTDQIVSTQSVDQLAFAQDRVNRGKNTALRVVSFTVDALHTPTDRSADLLAIAFGDRVQITNIPSTVANFTTWDGWIIGRAEAQDRDQHKFTFYAQPVLPSTGIYDTDLYANGGNNTISTTLTNVATTMKCTSADGVTLFETSAVNYYLLVDSEIVKVTACSAPVAGVQTLTISRAQLGTSAASHAVGVAPEVYADSTARINNGIYAF